MKIKPTENKPTARKGSDADARAALDPDPLDKADDSGSSWSRWINLDDALSGEPPPGPRICTWPDADEDGKPVARALFYPNEVHSVFGDPEALKSWLLLFSVVQEIMAGRHVCYLDMEANDRSIVERLRLLGAEREAISEFFHYSRPDERINDADRVAFKGFVRRHQPTLVVLDGVTEAFSALGLSVMSPEDTATWFRSFSRQFQVNATAEYLGPAIVELDHVVKDRDARNGWAIGSVHKKAGIKGAAYSVVNVAPFGKGRHGRSRLFLEKDSPGGVEWVPFGKAHSRLVGEFHCDDTSDRTGIDSWIESGTASDERPEREAVPLVETLEFRNVMHEVWKYIVNHPTSSLRVVRAGVTASNENVATALEFLERQGFVRNEAVGTKQKWVPVDGMEFDPVGATTDAEKGS